MKISPKFRKEEWESLDLTREDSHDWQTAIDILEDRINGRFLEPILSLETHKNKEIREFSGFVIMAIDCLLIETIQQFYKGNVVTKGMSDKAFHDFFQKSEEFKSFFDTINKSKIFYSQIRCGILHQAQTKQKSTIHIEKGKPMLEWIDPTNISEGVRIHRKLFHKEVSKIFDTYIVELRKDTNLNLRRKFEKKMKSIVM